MFEALQFIEYALERVIEEYDIQPTLRDTLDECRIYAKIRNKNEPLTSEDHGH